ncbi:MAG: response regulator [Myxococcota bacterium]
MKKILLVDDSKALRTLVARHLREQNWQVFEADDGQAGVMLALQHQPDLILLDVAMPHLDGTGALLKIRSKQSVRNTPVIMMTAASDRETVVKLARLGIQDYIVKPFTLKLMLSKIYKVFAQQAEASLQESAVPIPEPTSPSVVLIAPEGQPADHPDRPNLLAVATRSSLSDALRREYADILDVYVARDIDVALQLLVSYPPNAVLLDLNATHTDAVDAYKRLKFLPALLQTPFIVIKASDPLIQEKGERVGMANFISPELEPEGIVRLLEALEKERQAGRYGSNFVQTQAGMPILRWPEVIKLDKLKNLTYEVEDNLTRAAELGNLRLVVFVGAVKQFHDGHLLLLLAVQRKAAALGMQLAFTTQNDIARQFFQQYEDTRELIFFGNLEDAWQSIAG